MAHHTIRREAGGPPFLLPARWITMLYLSCFVGVGIGPVAGRMGNRSGNRVTMAAGAAMSGASVLLSLIPSVVAIAASLAGVCAGFFVAYSAPVGALNRKLESSRGRANSLGLFFYYLGGTAGIPAAGQAHHRAGWPGVVAPVFCFLLVPFAAGVLETRPERLRRREFVISNPVFQPARAG